MKCRIPSIIQLGCQQDKTTIDLDGFAPEDEECLSSLSQKSCKLVDEDVLNLVGLFDLDADSDTVDARFYENLFVLIPRNSQRIKENLG